MYGAGDEIAIRSGDKGAAVLLLAGKPLHEPLARYGPFVMNDRAEIYQAIEDYEAGRFGSISPEVVDI